MKNRKNKSFEKTAKIENGKIGKKRKKAFTLIELLAVIIILGVLMIIAIPSVTNYISDSRDETYIKTAKQLISGAKNFINSGKMNVYDLEASYFIPSTCIKTEKADRSPYGEFSPAYIIAQYNGNGFDYYWYSRDEVGIGVPTPTIEKDLDTDSLEKDIPADKINTQVKIANRKRNVVFNEDCTKIVDILKIALGGAQFFTDLENSRSDIIARDSTVDSNLRFYSGTSENYVTFNDETAGWRIIGIFDNKIKMIKSNSIGNMVFNTNNSSNYWPTSSLCNYLNTTYYNGLKEKAKSMIDDNTWYINGSDSLFVSAGDVYEMEKVNADYTWVGKVGLMSMSDYQFAAGASCTNLLGYSSDGNDIRKCKDNNWLFNGQQTWMITPSKASTPWERVVESTGYVNGFVPNTSVAVRPVVFLKQDVEIVSGSGTVNDPYVLGY